MSTTVVTPKFISDENASDDDRIVTAARPNTTATLANTTFLGGGARNIIVTTTGTGDNGKTTTITGTDVFSTKTIFSSSIWINACARFSLDKFLFPKDLFNSS